jgi:hypothetical protein
MRYPERVKLSPLALVVGLCGCGASSGQTQADAQAACGATTCTSSEVCDRTDPAGPTCIPAAGDLDGDGIPNSADFCNHVAGGDTDEDGDGLGDICDPCPIAPPPVTPDPDGDAVDRPCDPDPHTAGDQILLFEGFANGIPSKWKATTVAWTSENGDAVVSLAGQADADLLQIAVVPKTNLAVETAYRVDAVEAGAADHVVVVTAADLRPAGVATMACGLEHDDTSGLDNVSINTNSGVGLQRTNNAFTTTTRYQIGAYATGGNAGCTAIGDGKGLGVAQASLTPDSMGTIGIGAPAVSAHFKWVLVVGRD